MASEEEQGSLIEHFIDLTFSKLVIREKDKHISWHRKKNFEV